MTATATRESKLTKPAAAGESSDAAAATLETAAAGASPAASQSGAAETPPGWKIEGITFWHTGEESPGSGRFSVHSHLKTVWNFLDPLRSLTPELDAEVLAQTRRLSEFADFTRLRDTQSGWNTDLGQATSESEQREAELLDLIRAGRDSTTCETRLAELRTIRATLERRIDTISPAVEHARKALIAARRKFAAAARTRWIETCEQEIAAAFAQVVADERLANLIQAQLRSNEASSYRNPNWGDEFGGHSPF